MSCVNEKFTFDEWNDLLDGIEQLIEHKFHVTYYKVHIY